MHPKVWIGAVAVIFAVFLIVGFGMQIGARSNYPAGWWGPGMMGGYAMGPGMMAGGYGYGMAPWMMGPGYGGGYGFGMMPWMSGSNRPGQATNNFSADDAKNYFQRWLAFQGNPHLKLGTVTEKDADTITADIVTVDKEGLVQRFALNRHNGFIQLSEN
jgi:hypothetical protein